MTTVLTIEVADDNAFNTGWLAYLMGLDRPDPDRDPMGADGWDMGAQTPTLFSIRAVFDPGNTNYAVSLKAPKPAPSREAVANE